MILHTNMSSTRFFPVTEEEKINILNYIIKTKGYFNLRGKKYWRQMEQELRKEKKKTRVYHTLRHHFKTKMIECIDSFDIPKEEKIRIRDGYLATAQNVHEKKYTAHKEKREVNHNAGNMFSDEDTEPIETGRKESTNKKTINIVPLDLNEGKSSRSTPDIEIPSQSNKNTVSSLKQNGLPETKSDPVIVIEDSDENSEESIECSFNVDKLLINYFKLDEIYLKERYNLKIYEYFKEIHKVDFTPKQLCKRFTKHIFPNICNYNFLTHEQMGNFYKDAGVDIPENLKAILQTSPNTGDISTFNIPPEATSTPQKTKTVSQSSPVLSSCSTPEITEDSIPESLNSVLQNSLNWNDDSTFNISSDVTCIPLKTKDVIHGTPETKKASSATLSLSSSRVNIKESFLAISQNSPYSSDTFSEMSPVLTRNRRNTNTVVQNSLNTSSVLLSRISPKRSKILEVNSQKKLKTSFQNASNINIISPCKISPKITKDVHTQTTNDAQTSANCENSSRKIINCCYYPIEVKGVNYLIVSATSPTESKESIIEILSEKSGTKPENIHFVNFALNNLLEERNKFQNALISQCGDSVHKLIETEYGINVDLKDLFSSFEMHVETVDVDDDNNSEGEYSAESESQSFEFTSLNNPAIEKSALEKENRTISDTVSVNNNYTANIPQTTIQTDNCSHIDNPEEKNLSASDVSITNSFGKTVTQNTSNDETFFTATTQ